MNWIVVIHMLATALTMASASASESASASSSSDEEEERVRPHTENIASPSSPAEVSKNANWKTDEMCEDGKFVREWRTRQDDTYGDQKGLTKVEFYCTTVTTPVGGAGGHWIVSGVDEGKYQNVLYCPHSDQWVVGIVGTFGGDQWENLGMISVAMICDVPYWRTKAGPHQSVERGQVLPAFAWETHGMAQGWEIGGPRWCNEGQVVCGLNTNVDESGGSRWSLTGTLSDQNGINEMKIMCCDFPDGTGKRAADDDVESSNAQDFNGGDLQRGEDDLDVDDLRLDDDDLRLDDDDLSDEKLTRLARSI